MSTYIELDAFISALGSFQDSLKSDNDLIWEQNKPIYKGAAVAARIALDLPRTEINVSVPSAGAPYTPTPSFLKKAGE